MSDYESRLVKRERHRKVASLFRNLFLLGVVAVFTLFISAIWVESDKLGMTGFLLMFPTAACAITWGVNSDDAKG